MILKIFYNSTLLTVNSSLILRSLFIFRQDLRVHDNHWLWQTVQDSQEVFPVFIFDTNILSKFPEHDPRLWFISEALKQLDQDLKQKWSYLTVLYGNSVELIQSLASALKVDAIARNHSYGDNSLTRDQAITTRAATNNIQTKSYSDYLLVEPEEVIPMKVFTPFKNRWLKALASKDYTNPYTIETIYTPPLKRGDTGGIITYQWNNLIPPQIANSLTHQLSKFRPINWRKERLILDYSDYDNTRNIPSMDGTTRLSPYTRFGLVSIREIYRKMVLPSWKEGVGGDPTYKKATGDQEKKYSIPYLQKHWLVSDWYCVPYRSDNIEKAKELRKSMTLAEKKLWKFFQQQNFRTLRQKPIDHYIVDFYIASANLIIEVDGEVHDSSEAKEYDKYRTERFKEYWLEEIRFTNEEVYSDFEKVCKKILSTITNSKWSSLTLLSKEKEHWSPSIPLAKGEETLLSELAWREFRQHIPHYFPESRIIEFQQKRRTIARDNNETLFKARCEGRTWYPLVDAGMRQLVSEKRMHNRVRMVVASFLTKDLLIDRRRGEQFFAQHLLDYDANVNIGNRQRSASVWADPKPMRIFSPMLQSQRFDPECKYSKKYIPELENIHPDQIHDPLKYDLSHYGYVRPIIDHYERSKKAKDAYKR